MLTAEYDDASRHDRCSAIVAACLWNEPSQWGAILLPSCFIGISEYYLVEYQLDCML